MVTDLLDQEPKTELDVTRHAESNNTDNLAVLKHFFQEKVAQSNKALEKTKAEGRSREHLRSGYCFLRDIRERFQRGVEGVGRSNGGSPRSDGR